MPTLTEKTFYQYVKCPSWVYFNAHDAERLHDALLERLIDDGLLPESQKEILGDRSFVEVEHEDPEEAFSRTLEFMHAGEQTILRGVLIDGPMVGHPDLLERVEGASALGDYYYVACDIKRRRRIEDVYKFQGAFYAGLLGRIQKTKPVCGYVMTPDANVMSYRLDEFETNYHLTLEEIERIMAGQKPPHFLMSGCKQSPWFAECRKESIACDDLSLINRIWRSEVVALKATGIKTVKELAASDPDLLFKNASGLTRDRLHWIRMQAVALTEGRTIVMKNIPFPVSNTELYFDIESNPLRDFEFLFGILKLEDGKESYHSFVAESIGDEEKAWREFLAFMDQFPAAPVYHYGWYEIDVLTRLAVKYGDEERVRAMVKNQMHDLLMMMRDAIIFPLHFYSLKDIARSVGFQWREADASGVNAVLWHEEFLASGDTKKLQKIVEYNEDDCRATYAVKKWVAEKAAE